jgi:uncharacterized membrane protein YjgN (DUF898 family)
MATDGDIDYRSYDDAQLNDAATRIDRHAFPLNYANLTAEMQRRRNAAAAAAGASQSADAPRRYRLEFRGDPKEYFRIWIVNLALTIATLGIYSAWAKVRKQRFFYSNTSLAGSAFGYHGEPLKILKGRLIAAALAGMYFFAVRTSVRATLVVFALLILATPWLVVKSRTFAARVTSWRGLRFNFRQDYAGAYRAFVGWLVLGMMTLGILMPRVVRERYIFLVSRTSYGDTAFDCKPGIWRFYKTTLGAIAYSAMIMLGLVFVTILVGRSFGIGPRASGNAARVMPIISMLLTYALLVPVVLGYTYARNHNEVLNHTTLGPNRIHANLSASTLIGIYLTNVVAMIFTLGLYTPYAQIRLARYRLGAIELEAHGSLDHFAASPDARVPAAVGEELSSFFDLDFGF